MQDYLEENINPASIDIRIGDNLLIESAESTELVKYPIARHSKTEPYLLVPGQFVLAASIESFSLPTDIAAEFRLKSSRAREGYDQALAVWADCGWHGTLTLELKNNRQLHPLPIYPGMPIGQIIFHRMLATPEKDYLQSGGRYHGDQDVAASKG